MRLTCCFLVVALRATTQAVAGITGRSIRRDFNTDDPSASDPKTPPSTLKRPVVDLEDPFAGKSITVPDSCNDFQRPSEKCLQDLKAGKDKATTQSTGGLTFEKNSKCGDKQKSILETAAYEAMVLASFASQQPSSAKEIATWQTYIGPDYINQLGRITGNLGRILDLKARKKYDIITSCNDKVKWCSVRIDGKGVAGYAWTYYGWFGTYYYITLCPVFFTADNLNTKFEQIERDLGRGETKYAREAVWQANTGMAFLHEMMHLNATNKDQPHIIDERVQEDGTGPRAYGPKYVHMLARRSLNQGGGARRASTNADSYAWLANSLYFYEETGYFPAPPKRKNSNDLEQTRNLDLFTVHLGSFDSHPSDETLEARFNAEIEVMKTPDLPPPEPTAGPPPVYTPRRCFVDVSQEDCKKIPCPSGMKPGCVWESLVTFRCTCH